MREGFADDRPAIVDPEPGAHLCAVRVGGGRRDPVDHAVGEVDLPLHPVRQLRVAQARERREHPARHPAVVLDVVAGHDRERCDPALTAARQARGQEAERGARDGSRREVMDHVRLGRIELAGRLVEVVAALGHRERDDPRRPVREALDHRVRVVRREQVVHDGPDDPRLPGPVG